MRKRIGTVLWGLVFLAIGIGIGGRLLGFWEFHLFFTGWWTLIFIVPSCISIIQEGAKISNLLFLVLGILMLLCARGYLEWELMWKMMVPVAFIIIGLGLVFRSIFNIGGKRITIPNEKRSDETVVFSGKKFLVENEFYGMDADAVFGGVTIDLRQAVIQQDISMDLTAVFGSVDVYAPANVQVKLSDMSLFGGCSNHHRNLDGNAPVVYINATALFGGVDVKS